MGKVIVLKFDGDLEQNGFQIKSFVRQEMRPYEPTVEEEGSLHNDYGCWTVKKETGFLPAHPKLALLIEQHWSKKYREIGSPARKLTGQTIEVRATLSQRIKECVDSAKLIKDELRSWLKSPEFSNVDRQLREAITSDEEIRVLICTKNRILYQIPWEEWDLIKHHSKTELIFSKYTALLQDDEDSSGSGSQKSAENQSSNMHQIRSQPQNQLFNPIIGPKVTILAILGHSEGIDIKTDRQYLEGLKDADVTFLVEPRRKDINEQLWEQSWDIIFFAGHSETENDTGRIYLNSNEEYLELENLWHGLRQAVDRGLKAAIFNSCDGLGLLFANQIDDLQIPLMVVMRDLVPDEVAQQFFMNFIRAFREGKPFHLAKREATGKLEGLEDEYPCATWLPVIYQRSEIPPLQWKPPLPPPVAECNLLAAGLASFIAVSLVLFIRPFGVFAGSELKAYDYLMRMQPIEAKDDRLFLITIDVEDADDAISQGEKNYTITDAQLEKLLQKLVRLNPKIIGINNYRNKPVDRQKYPFLVNSLKDNKNLIANCSMTSPEYDVLGRSAPPDILSLPPEQIENKLGFSMGTRDIQDDRVRRDLLMMEYEDEDCPSSNSFSLVVAERYLKAIDSNIRTNLDFRTYQIGNLILPTLEATGAAGYPPDNGEYGGLQILLNYRSRPSFENIAEALTLREFLSMNEGELRDLVKDRIVLIGTVVEEDNSFYSTPYTKGSRDDTAGLYIDAHAISQIVSAVLDNRPLMKWWPRGVEYIWIGTWSLIGGLIAWYFRRKSIVLFVSSIAIVILVGFCYVLLPQGYWIPLVPPALALILAASGTLVLPVALKALPNSDSLKKIPNNF
ncbi:MAG: CHASE2 domain-containing protein [Okeania sp. SIO3H1]|nr:CHASE2 domain-containing protein [Okeania sp. SIO3H1]